MGTHMDRCTGEACNFFGSECMMVYDYFTLEIKDVNSVFVEKYGYSRDEITGEKITFLGEKYRPSAGNARLHEKSSPPAIWKHFRKDGSSFYVQFTFHRANLDGKDYQIAVLHDVTEQIGKNYSNPSKMPRSSSFKEQLPLAVIEWEVGGTIRDWSVIAEKVFGYRMEEMLSVNLYETGIIPESKRESIEDQVHALKMNGHSFFTFEQTSKNKKGEILHTNWYNSANFNRSGQLLSIYSIVEDITDRKNAEDRVIESEQRFRVLSEASNVGVYLIQNGRLKYVNPRFCEITGFQKDVLLHNFDPIRLIHKEDAAKLVDLKTRFENSEIDTFEVSARAYNRRKQMIYVKIYGSKTELNNQRAIMGVVVDQTREIESQNNFRAALSSYKDLFNSISDAIYIHDDSGAFIEMNDTAIRMFGYSREELIGKDPSYFAAPGKVDLDQTRRYIERALNGERQRFEWWARRKSGEVFPIEVTLNPGKYFGNDVIIAVGREITERMQQQKELTYSEELFRQLFQNAPVAIAMLDKHNEVQSVNQSFEKLFGYRLEEIRGLDLDSMIVPEEFVDEARELSNSTDSFEMTSVRRKKDGRLMDVLIYGVPVVVEGKTIAIYGIYVDITERKKNEEKIRQSLKEKEVLLAEIHHRVKNNLAVITGLLDLQSHKTDNEVASAALKDSQMRINTMALIHEKLYQNETLSNIEFNQYIEELTGVIERTHRKADRPIRFELDSDPVLFTITQAIPCGLLLNEILTNSYKHAFQPPFNGEAVIGIKLCMNGDQNVHLSVTDNGNGLPGDFHELGSESLGLTLIKTLARQLEANLEVDTSKGTGYRFTFKLEK
jgi:PAS domain S-box-containing protein